MLTPSISNAVVDLIIFAGPPQGLSEQQVAIGIFDPRQKRAQPDARANASSRSSLPSAVPTFIRTLRWLHPPS
jgi:hypothetical protein